VRKCATRSRCTLKRICLDLPKTAAYVGTIEHKLCNIDPEFYCTPAMSQDQWRDAGNNNRHIVTRFPSDCRTRGFHTATNTCVCLLCGGHAAKYHLITCSERRHILNYYAMEA